MFNTKLKLVISILAAIFILSADAYLFWLIGDAAYDISDMSTKIDLEIKRSENNAAVRNLWNKTKSERLKLENYFIPHDGEVAFIEQLESFGQMVGVKTEIEGVGFEAVKVSTSTSLLSDLEVMKVKLQVVGNWSQINSYLYLIENLPYRLTIDRLDTALSGDPLTMNKSSKITWSLLADISVYKKK